MTRGFLTRLESELAELTRNGAHLDELSAIRRRRAAIRARRGLVILATAATLAVSLDSEFAATANGYGGMQAVRAG